MYSVEQMRSQVCANKQSESYSCLLSDSLEVRGKGKQTNACTLVPTVYRWHGKMKFKFHFHFSFFVFVWHWKTDLNVAFRFSFSPNFQKTHLNFVFRFSFSHHFEKRVWISFFVFVWLVMNLWCSCIVEMTTGKTLVIIDPQSFYKNSRRL